MADELFDLPKPSSTPAKDLPLAVRMRPRTLDEVVGQDHLLGEEKLLRRAIQADRITSLILFGPPGCGKTALAHVIASHTQSQFEPVNATTSNVQELRKIIAQATKRAASGQRTICFIDEIHRFNRAQQDVLLPHVEDRTIILIGATVHNPFFAIVSPLLSRSMVFELKPLSEEAITTIVRRALIDQERGLGNFKVKLDDDALGHVAKVSDGDARRALNAIEVAVRTTTPGKQGAIHLTLPVIEESIQKKQVVYDKTEDAHYDTISAFIKSMRGSDPDATLYWLAKMIYAGEDPRFIARRIVISASEDVGNADPQALVVATAAFHTVELIGMPEGQIPLAQAAVYVACAPKSNAAYLGIKQAMADVEAGRLLEVPDHLKDAHYPGAKRLGRGKGYKYAHDYPGHHVDQEHLPSARKYYQPTQIGYERQIAEFLERLKRGDGKPAASPQAP